MLTSVLTVPDHPACIPAIGGPFIADVPQAVNGLMKLAIKLHAEKTDLLVCITAGLPIMHHRLMMAKGKEHVRFFADNVHEEREVHMVFPGATELYTPMELMFHDQKVPVEGYVQEHEITAIDDTLLAFLFYCHAIEWYPQLLIIGVSDLSPTKHQAAGYAIGRVLGVQEDVTTAVVLCGQDERVQAVGQGVLSTWENKTPEFRELGRDIFQEKELVAGYYRQLE